MSEEADEDLAELRLYIKPGCPWCIAAEEFLSGQGYRYTRLDVLSDPALFAEMESISGQTLAPTMTYGDLLLADFGVPELEKFLAEHDIEPPDAAT